MSFYNLMFGKNPHSSILLALLGLKENDIERYRDCFLDENGITIHTRTGGGNREDYPNETLTSHACYIGDADDEGDYTYANYFFKFPDDIKDDMPAFLDSANKGIPASIIRKVQETLNRPETASDKFTKLYNAQSSVYKELRFHFGVYETNGHTIVPLSDEAMGTLLKSAEANDIEGREGEFMPYSVRPYKIQVGREVPRWNHEANNLCRVKIDLGKTWEIDTYAWERYKGLFSEKYPKAIAAIQARIPVSA